MSEVNIKVSADVSNATAGLKRVADSMSNLQKSSGLDKLGEKFTSIGNKIKSFGETASKYISLPLLGAGVASVKLASDMTENINKTQVVFGKNAQAVQNWANTTLKSFGIASVSALDMASKFGDMGTSMGLTQETMTGMSEKLVGLSGDLASFKNIGVDQASEALTGIFTGETESLKSLGVVMTEANLKAFALKEGITKSYDSMSEAEKVNLRYQYVLNTTKNSMSDFGNTSGSTANQMRTFSNTLQELGVSFGQYILPVITPVIAKLNDMLKAFGALDPATKKLILVLAGIAIVVFPLIAVIGNFCIAVGGIISVVSAVGIATVGLIAGFVAIGVAVGVLVYLVVSHWTQIKAYMISTWNSIKASIIGVWNGIVAGASSFYSGVASKFTAVVQAGRSAVSGIQSTFAGVFSYISQPFINAYSKVSGIISNIKSACANIWSGFRSVHIQLPHFSLSGSFSLNPLRVPVPNVSWYANGGIVDKPTIFGAGEAGVEAIVPLRNKQSMDMIGTAVTEHMPDNLAVDGSGTTIVNNFKFEDVTIRDDRDIKKLAESMDKELAKRAGRDRRGKGRNRDI